MRDRHEGRLVACLFAIAALCTMVCIGICNSANDLKAQVMHSTQIEGAAVMDQPVQHTVSCGALAFGCADTKVIQLYKPSDPQTAVADRLSRLVTVERVNAAQSPHLVSRYKVDRYPTFLVLKKTGSTWKEARRFGPNVNPADVLMACKAASDEPGASSPPYSGQD